MAIRASKLPEAAGVRAESVVPVELFPNLLR
jgi:hypothetical protein